MSQAPNIDGILIQWGDRLFYPGTPIPGSKFNRQGGSKFDRRRQSDRSALAATPRETAWEPKRVAPRTQAATRRNFGHESDTEGLEGQRVSDLHR